MLDGGVAVEARRSASADESVAASGDGVREGWQLGDESWSFHRQFYARVGRPTAFREYTAILWAIRAGGAEKLAPYAFKHTLADGVTIVVRGGRLRLSGVEPADWTPPRVKGKPAQPQPVAQPPQVAEPTPPAPTATRPLGPSTLTLGNPAAAKALAERLRRMGVAAHTSAPPSWPPARQHNQGTP